MSADNHYKLSVNFQFTNTWLNTLQMTTFWKQNNWKH